MNGGCHHLGAFPSFPFMIFQSHQPEVPFIEALRSNGTVNQLKD